MIEEILQEMWEKTPDILKYADYCFYIGSGFKNVPDKFKNKKIRIVYIIDEFQVYYAPNCLFTEK